MLKFLLQLVQKNKTSLSIISGIALAAGGTIWNFDLAKLVPTGTIPPVTQWQLRIWLTLILISIYLLSLLVVTLYSYKKESKGKIEKQPDDKIEIYEKETPEHQFKRSILLYILKLRGLKQVASPQNIANQMNQDWNIILPYLLKLHNEHFVTFITGGDPPTLNTDFFLTPKAFEIINIDDAQSVQLKRQNLFSAYGVFWDTEFNMYCLSCTKPLKHSTRGPSIFNCSDPKCDSKYVLKDDYGNEITKQEAINRLKTSR